MVQEAACLVVRETVMLNIRQAWSTVVVSPCKLDYIVPLVATQCVVNTVSSFLIMPELKVASILRIRLSLRLAGPNDSDRSTIRATLSNTTVIKDYKASGSSFSIL